MWPHAHDHVCAIGKDSAAVMKSLQEHPLDTITTLQELKELIGGYNTATTPKKRGKTIAWRNYCTSHFQKWKSRIASVQAKRGPVS